MGVVITTLVENGQGEHLGLTCEHGLSFLIEKDGQSFLFDTGKSDAFLNNAKQLNLDPFRAQTIILSHGHYDHSGGVPHFLKSPFRRKEVELVGHPHFFRAKYSTDGARTEFLGNGFTRAEVEASKGSIRFAAPGVDEIAPGVYVISDFDKTHPEEQANPRFVFEEAGQLVHDTFADELMVAVETDKGLVLILGCAHPGIMNMIDTVKARLHKTIYAVVGGTHLVEADDRRMTSTVSYLKGLDCAAIGVSHCTGPKAMAALEKADGRFFHNRTGSSLRIG